MALNHRLLPNVFDLSSLSRALDDVVAQVQAEANYEPMEVDDEGPIYPAQLQVIVAQVPPEADYEQMEVDDDNSPAQPLTMLPIEYMDVDPVPWPVPENLPEWNIPAYENFVDLLASPREVGNLDGWNIPAYENFVDLLASPREVGNLDEWNIPAYENFVDLLASPNLPERSTTPPELPNPSSLPPLPIPSFDLPDNPPPISKRKAEKSRAQDEPVEPARIEKEEMAAPVVPVKRSPIDPDNLSSSSRVTVEEHIQRTRFFRNSDVVEFSAPLVVADVDGDTSEEQQTTSIAGTSTDISLLETDFNEAETSFTTPFVVSPETSRHTPFSSPPITALESDEFFLAPNRKVPDLAAGGRWLKVSRTPGRNVDNDSVLPEDASIDRSFLATTYPLVEENSTKQLPSLADVSISSPIKALESDEFFLAPSHEVPGLSTGSCWLRVSRTPGRNVDNDSVLPEDASIDRSYLATTYPLVEENTTEQLPSPADVSISSPIKPSKSDDFFLTSNDNVATGNRWLKISRTPGRNVDNESILSEDASIDQSYLAIAYPLVENEESTEQPSSSSSSPFGTTTPLPSRKRKQSDVETPEFIKVLAKRKRGDDVFEASASILHARKRQRVEDDMSKEAIVQTSLLPTRKRRRDEDLSEPFEALTPLKRRRPNAAEPSKPIAPLPTRKRQRGDETEEAAAPSTPPPTRKRRRMDQSLEAFAPPVTSTPVSERSDHDDTFSFEESGVENAQCDSRDSILHGEDDIFPVGAGESTDDISEGVADETNEDGDEGHDDAAQEEISVEEEDVVDDDDAEGDDGDDEEDGEEENDSDDDSNAKEARRERYLELCREVFGDGEESDDDDLLPEHIRDPRSFRAVWI